MRVHGMKAVPAEREIVYIDRLKLIFDNPSGTAGDLALPSGLGTYSAHVTYPLGALFARSRVDRAWAAVYVEGRRGSKHPTSRVWTGHSLEFILVCVLSSSENSHTLLTNNKGPGLTFGNIYVADVAATYFI